MNTHELISEQRQEQYGETQTIGRRQIMEASFWTCTGMVGLAATGVSVRFLIGNALEITPGQWAKVDEVAKLTAGEMHRITYRIRAKDAWRSREQAGTLYVYSTDGVEYTVLDATCTHLGCIVHWRTEQEHFSCPCHEGYFDRDGSVLSGPPPAPLAKVQTKIEEGVLYALI